MPSASYAIVCEPCGSVFEDRARVFETGDGWIIAVADGAGGTSDGAAAAEQVIARVEALVAAGTIPVDENDWTAFLEAADHELFRADEVGEAAVVVLSAATASGVCGASVGDCEAWLMDSGDCHVLTAAQRRKPLLGTGAACPLPIWTDQARGRLVVGTDGLFRYASAWSLREAMNLDGEPDRVCRTLIDLVRLPSGRFQDDVSIVVCDLANLPAPFVPPRP